MLVKVFPFALIGLLTGAWLNVYGQTALKPRLKNSAFYSGIEVGSKGVKLSVIEIGKNAQRTGNFYITKDTSVNTDFISFDKKSFSSTLTAFAGLYKLALNNYQIPASQIFTVISSGVKMQSEKDSKTENVQALIDSFRLTINEPHREVEVVDVMKEAKLSHLGIIPRNRRFNTFLFDIGSGNTKGGFFPYGNTNDFKLFQINWGTKSTANAVDNISYGDTSMGQYQKLLQRVLKGAEDKEIVYAVNSSGAYPLSDNVAVSGGIAWAVATLTHPEMVNNPIVTVTYDDVKKLNDKLSQDFVELSVGPLIRDIKDPALKQQAMTEIKRVHKVFDQRSLMAGSGLLLKIMRQFESAFESKQFFLVKNGQVGWVSAYVDQALDSIKDNAANN